jgi:hypothetical protein
MSGPPVEDNLPTIPCDRRTRTRLRHFPPTPMPSVIGIEPSEPDEIEYEFDPNVLFYIFFIGLIIIAIIFSSM